MRESAVATVLHRGSGREEPTGHPLADAVDGPATRRDRIFPIRPGVPASLEGSAARAASTGAVGRMVREDDR
ncbi:hypothetical protein GCM10022630_09430 [Thermobifida alba]